jgi:hypothetical protein
MQYHNVNGPSPTVAELVRFMFERETRVELIKGRLPGTALAGAQSFTSARDNSILSDLIATGWAFEHRSITPTLRGLFQVLTTLD